MTTFTMNDFVPEKDGSVTVNVEPIPFAGLVSIQDKEDTEHMLRHQLHIVTEQLNTVQAECQRLRNKLREAGIND
jgi:hypothetical protein